MKRNLYIIRHGETKGNIERRYIGSTDEALTEAAKLELQKKGMGLRNIVCFEDAEIFVSPMRRCRETAQLLFETDCCVEESDLRECDFGEFEYKNYVELKDDARYQAYIDSGGVIGFPGGESRAQYISRTKKCFDKILADCKKNNIIIVAHGGTIMAILDAYSRPHRDYFDWQTGCGEGYFGKIYIDYEDNTQPICISNIEKISW